MGVVMSIILTRVSEMAIMLGGVVPYVPQYLDIKRTKNAEGFSTFVCLTLLIANILRVFFWFGKRFELPLLIQSIIMIATMVFMVYVCVGVKSKSDLTSTSRTFFDMNLKYFWRWDDFLSYIEFLLLLCTLIGMATYMLLSNVVFVELLGFAAVFTEAMLGMPQFYRNHVNKSTAGMSHSNHDVVEMLGFATVFTEAMLGMPSFYRNHVNKSTAGMRCWGFAAVFTEAMLGMPQFYRNHVNKSTAGMSKKMVAMWFSGDLFKTVYFVIRRAPAQFWICGTLQIIVDLAIFTQVFVFRHSHAAVKSR